MSLSVKYVNQLYSQKGIEGGGVDTFEVMKEHHIGSTT